MNWLFYARNFLFYTNYTQKHGIIKFTIISHSKTRGFREAYTGLPVVRVTENQKALNCVVLKYSIPVSEE